MNFKECLIVLYVVTALLAGNEYKCEDKKSKNKKNYSPPPNQTEFSVYNEELPDFEVGDNGLWKYAHSSIPEGKTFSANWTFLGAGGYGQLIAHNRDPNVAVKMIPSIAGKNSNCPDEFTMLYHMREMIDLDNPLGAYYAHYFVALNKMWDVMMNSNEEYKYWTAYMERMGVSLASDQYYGILRGREVKDNIESYVEMLKHLNVFHASGILHCDIKLSNMMTIYNEKDEYTKETVSPKDFKFIDYGLSVDIRKIKWVKCNNRDDFYSLRDEEGYSKYHFVYMDDIYALASVILSLEAVKHLKIEREHEVGENSQDQSLIKEEKMQMEEGIQEENNNEMMKREELGNEQFAEEFNTPLHFLNELIKKHDCQKQSPETQLKTPIYCEFLNLMGKMLMLKEYWQQPPEENAGREITKNFLIEMQEISDKFKHDHPELKAELTAEKEEIHKIEDRGPSKEAEIPNSTSSQKKAIEEWIDELEKNTELMLTELAKMEKR
jgi:hypothetical protein